MSEIKKIEVSDLPLNDTALFEQPTTNLQQFQIDSVSFEDDEDDDNSVLYDLQQEVGIEAAKTGAEGIASFMAGFYLHKSSPQVKDFVNTLSNYGINTPTISFSSRLAISRVGKRAVSVVPVVGTTLSAIIDGAMYYQEGGMDEVYKHKYEISGAALAALATAGIFAAATPVGWAAALIGIGCIIGSVAAEQVGAFIDTTFPDGIPTDSSGYGENYIY